MSVVVVVQPAQIQLDPEPGETVFLAAGRQGYRWPTICGGLGTCRTCLMLVDQGQENCSPIGDLEAEGLDALQEPRDGVRRLACQTRVSGDVVVTKRGVKPVPR
ncbi:MAG: 2Fe-2S iron-sulfur cluster-binding protein [Sporichthyaceae bacterium]